MAQKLRQPRTNRYKRQNGKGATALAVFLVLVLLLLVGSYYFLAWQQKQPPVVKLQPAGATVPRPVPASPPATPDDLRRPIKEAGPDWEHYTDDAVPTPVVPLPRVKGSAELAIIVDDMGSSLQEIRSLTSIGVPLSYAVIPGLRHDREVAVFAAAQGGQVLVHMPMQSKEYPQRRLEANGLLLAHDERQVLTLLESYFERIPQAVGANNHTGSAFTENRAGMQVVLGQLKERGLFFVDSITTPSTVGPQVAADLQLKTARRDVFLDNEQDEIYIRGQLDKAVARARKTGRAIAICHPHPVTIATLAKTLPDLKQQGVTLVFVSKLVY